MVYREIKGIIILMLLTISIFSVGCKRINYDKAQDISKDKEINSLGSFEIFGKDKSEKSKLLLVNNPSEEQFNLVKISETINLDDMGETVLVIPKNPGSIIRIWSLEFKDGNLIPNQKIYENKETPKDFVLEVKVIRPEGIPQYMIEFTSSSTRYNYIFSYNGKTGTPNIEYVVQ